MWTRFMDMHSGGGQKEDFVRCYIEAPEAEAVAIFYNRFRHNPNRVTCTCCGEDYSITESETLEDATEYDRGDVPLVEYCKQEGVCVIRASQILTADKAGEVPEQGYVWQE